jgi:hypothetical protein
VCSFVTNYGRSIGRNFIECHVCSFVTNRGRSIACNFIDCTDITDRVGSFITIGVIIAPYLGNNVRRV